MKRKPLILVLIAIYAVGLVGCSSRYTYTHESTTIDETVEFIAINEIDSEIIIEFSDEYESLKVNYCESKEVDEIRYDIGVKDGQLNIKKNDSTNGSAFHLSSNDVEDEVPELKIEIPIVYMIKDIDIAATDSSVKIVNGKINNLHVETTYYPIELDATAVNNFKGATSYDSITATIIGDPTDFTVKSIADGGENNLKNHTYSGEKQLDLQTKDGDINVNFIDD